MTSADGSPVPDYGSLLRLDGRSFAVLGAGQGIGRQSAHALAGQGARVVCVDLDERLAEEIAAEVSGIPCVADARKASEVERVVDEAVGRLGALDGVVDIIGVARWAALVDMPEDDWDWCHDMVLRHAFHVVKYAGRAMSANGRGTMVFVASISGISSAPFHAAYGAAKAGLMSLVRSAAIELRPADIRVNAVAPGVIATPRAVTSRGVDVDELANGSLDSMGRTRDIASTVLFLASDLAHYVTGQTLVVDGGLLTESPLGHTAAPVAVGRALGDSAWLPTQPAAPTKGAPHQ
ncbi:MAG TPA: SDR family NAD(P)-dependent oxidoreductase [Acidimicrobiales bacterium]|nr:SDR family NAD(P)-dependent oxidoreductase [Acidimicrobiales bacterium]